MPDETQAPDLLDTLKPSDEAAALVAEEEAPTTEQAPEADVAAGKTEAPADAGAQPPLETASADLDVSAGQQSTGGASQDAPVEPAPAADATAAPDAAAEPAAEPAAAAPSDASPAAPTDDTAADPAPTETPTEPAASDALVEADEGAADAPAKEDDKSADPVIPNGVVPSTDSELPALGTDDISPKAPVAAPVIDGSNANPAIPQAPSEPEADKAAAGGAGDIGATPEPASEDAADEAKPEEAKADEPVIAQVPSDSATIFDGRSGPSPAPELGDEEALPHPALSGQGAGSIPGTTESTAVFFPPVGDTDPGLASEPVIVVEAPGAGKKDEASSEQADGTSLEQPPAPSDEAAPTDQVDPVPAIDDVASGQDAEPTPVPAPEPASAPAAVPTAAHAPDAFGELNADGDAAMDEIDESEAEVLRLELKGLANLALALVKRIELISQKKAVGEHIECIQVSAQQVVSGALNIFDTDEEELDGYEAADAGDILDAIGPGESDFA